VTQPPFVPRPGRARIALATGAWLLFAAGCAGPVRLAEPARGGHGAGADSARVVLEVRLRRSAELTDPRAALRLFDQELRVEYRVDGRGPGLDAGEVTIDGRPLFRQVSGRGAVSYRLGRDEPEGGTQAGGDPWATIANAGGSGVPATSARLRLASFPVVTRPSPGQGVLRADELQVVMLPPLPGIWVRVTLAGGGDPVSAIDLGEGRWLFPRGALSGLGTGRGRLLVEVESSCGDCPGAGAMRANWSSRIELELALTLL